MHPDKWKPALLMNFRNIVHKPRMRSVTTIAILPQSGFVHISMARCAFFLCFGKNQCGMAKFTIGFCMLPHQWHFSQIMIKGINLRIYHPSFIAMANITAHRKAGPMGRYGLS
jgi:hypothetical protein